LSNYFIPLSVSGKLTGTLSGFIAHVKPTPFDLLCAWREVPILRQQISWQTRRLQSSSSQSLLSTVATPSSSGLGCALLTALDPSNAASP
jgi:hypothetical protein